MASKQTPAKSDNEIFSLLKADTKVKKTQGEVPFAKNIGLFDLSIKARGPREDEVFSKSPFYRQTIRRGLSFIKPEGEGPKICRRGLQKFFDIKFEYFDILKGTFDKKSMKLTWDEERLYHVIFDEAEEALKKGEKVVVYKTEKANGENAQVSYNAEFDAWVVASKNVSILVRNLADVKEYVKYGDKRYGFATLIAETWLKLVERVPNVEELKKELKGKTLVGEYCGNPNHQHLVEYSEITILFFALVEYHSDRSCLPIQTTQSFLERHNLPKVRMTPRKECQNIKDLTDILTELAKEVSENTIEEDAEGTVLYFELHTPDRVEILSLSKLKTLEYRLYRKLREKLKMIISNGKSASEQLSRYIKEVEGLCSLYKPPKPLAEYYETARLALDFVANHTDIARRLGISSRFIDFLKVIKECLANKKTPQVSDFQKILDTVGEDDDSDLGDEGGREEEPKDKEQGEGKQDTKGKKGKKGDNEEEKKIETKSEHRKKGKKSTDEENEFEEKKLSDEKSKPAKKGEVDLPKRIVLITPPLYFDWDLRKKIIERAGAKELEGEWRESTPIQGKRSIVLLNRFPSVTKKTELETNTVFLVAGFDQDTQKSTLKRLESLAQEKDRFQLGGTEFTYVQSKDKEKSLELLWANSQKFTDSIQQVLPNNCHILHLSKPDKILEEIDLAIEKLKNFQSTLEVQPEAEPELKKADSHPKGKKTGSQILAFIPIGIPGMGKTTFLNLLKKLLEEKGCEITIISSDKIRKQHMDEKMKSNPKMTEEKAFENSAKPAKKQFFDEVERAIQKTATLDKDKHIIFLDKNHPPNIIQDTIDFFGNPKYKAKYRIRTVILKPQCGENFRTKHNIYPFSLTFLLTCIRRAINRNEHETLTGDEIKIAKVLVSFFNLYKGYKAREGDFKMLGANFLMELPFTSEDPEVEKQIPVSLTTSLQDVLTGLKGFEPDEDKVIRFLDELSAWKGELKNPDPNLLYQSSVDNLNKCFELFELKRDENER